MSLKPPRPAHDLNNLIRWLGRDPWGEELAEVMEEHFAPSMEIFDLEFEEIEDLLGDHLSVTLQGCAFEDFLTPRGRRAAGKSR